MRWSKSYLFTLKETPADAEIASHVLLVRGGFIRKVAPGIFTYGPLMLKALRKFEKILRDELDKRGCTEVLMPVVQPRELWEESGRWVEMGEGLQKLKNRNGHEFCLGATHEEVVTDFARKDVKSYRDLPFNLYQIQTKFRDEIRPRFGLMRGREFIMKDAYSFDRDNEGALGQYKKMYEAYRAIFDRLGVTWRVVQADSGNIGGNQSQEFHILAESGEDQLLVSDSSDYAANAEVCPALNSHHPVKEEAPKAVEEFATPGHKSIEDLSKSTGLKPEELVKTMFFAATDDPKLNLNPVAICLRGSDEVNPIKLKNHFGLANPPALLSDEDVLRITGARPGSCGPVGLKIPVLIDHGVKQLKNFIVGANKDGFHLKNVNIGRDFQPVSVGDFRVAKAGDLSPDGKGHLKAFRGIEVGHIFYLGTKYSSKMQAHYLSAEGDLRPIEMGCYGIGVSRTVQAVIEQNHDKDGIIWPISIAPFDVHVALLDPNHELAAEIADKIYGELLAEGIECLVDDRSERPGVKFKDADLLGMPLRVIIGAKGLENGEVELVVRKTKQVKKVKALEAIDEIIAWIKAERTKAKVH